ncbi:Bifunctional P-protein, chorismate mutase/prephenate dehydratase [Candidatus Magnetoovum chiemensis]|nr:Bifunctional P-protein, chorismate mutase/prephenate dehydratase [Candidatus Magnetoovum chiemensis]
MKQIEDMKKLRDEIDKIDEEILRLLNDRSEIALEIGEIKKIHNLEYYNPQREKEIIERLQKLNKGRFPNNTLKIIFKEIFCASLTLEQPVCVAYLGPQATFTHLAAIRYFSSSCKFLSSSSIREVFETVEANKANFGVVPIENSTEGIVTYTIDMFIDFNLKISGEVLLEIEHHLLSKEKEQADIKKIYSHPQPTAQCRLWLEKNMLGIPIYETPSTSQAANLAANEPNSAAIGSELAAKQYDLNIIERNIESYKDNITRFLVISKEEQERTGKDKTSIMFNVKDEPGTLHEILTPFKKANINLTKIESRPSKKKAWDYVFFADIEGHIEDKKVKKALEGIAKRCTYLKILGSYHSIEKP